MLINNVLLTGKISSIGRIRHRLDEYIFIVMEIIVKNECVLKNKKYPTYIFNIVIRDELVKVVKRSCRVNDIVSISGHIESYENPLHRPNSYIPNIVADKVIKVDWLLFILNNKQTSPKRAQNSEINKANDII